MQMNRRQSVKTMGSALLGSTLVGNPMVGTAITHFASASARNQAPSGAAITLESRKALFVDSRFIAQSAGARLRLHPPKKTGERLIESEHPWENATINWFSVLKDGDRYRMWYECYDVPGWPTADDTSFCYAESRDGIHSTYRFF